MSATAAALRDGLRDARAAWGPAQTATTVLAVLLAALPLAGLGFVHAAELAGWLYLALAATGLVLAVGFAGLPSLAQGAFLGIGALATAVLSGRYGWAPMAALPVSVGAAVAAGLLAGRAVVRLSPVLVAVATWLLTWLVASAAREFPALSGGAQGYLAGSPLGPTAHYELALGLTVAAIGLLAALRSAPAGIRLRAVRDDAAAAAALGVDGGRLRYAAFAASAGIAGLAGALSVQLAGVSDPDAFGPETSLRLLVAVLLGGAAHAAGGAAGVAILGAIALAAELYGALFSDLPQLQAALTAVLLLTFLGARNEGLVPWAAARLGRRRRRVGGPTTPTGALERSAPGAVTATGLVKAYGGLRALDGLDLAVAPGESLAIVGANGSGKTTALRALGAAVRLDGGSIGVDGAPLGDAPPAAAAAGVVRTLQRPAVFARLTVLESAMVGAALHAPDTGALRSLAATPRARAAARRVRAQALAALGEVGLAQRAGEPAARLDGFGRRRLMLAAALAARPRVLLLDEPGAGAGAAELDALAHILRSVQAGGVSIVLVEHNRRLVGAVADRVTTIADGRAA